LGKADRGFAIELTRRGFVHLVDRHDGGDGAKTYSLYHPDIDNATVQPLSIGWRAYARRQRLVRAGQFFSGSPEGGFLDADRLAIVGQTPSGANGDVAHVVFV